MQLQALNHRPIELKILLKTLYIKIQSDNNTMLSISIDILWSFLHMRPQFAIYIIFYKGFKIAQGNIHVPVYADAVVGMLIQLSRLMHY